MLSSTQSAIMAAAITPPPAPSPITPLGRMTVQQIHTQYLRAFQNTNQALRSAINSQINQLFLNGKPTAQQLANFNANVAGALDAAAFGTSSQLGLLPGKSGQLATNIENALLGSGSTSLLSRIQNLTQQARTTASASALRTAVSNQLLGASQLNTASLNRFFNTTSLNQLSVDSTTGQKIPLQQFMSGQLVNQLNNTLGALNQSFSNLGNSFFFNSNGTTPTNAQLFAFQSSAQQALATASSQLASTLSVFGSGASQIAPQLQSALFGSGTSSTSLLNSLIGVPTSATDFNTNTSTAFGNAFQTTTSAMRRFFGGTTPPVFNPNGPATQVFNPSVVSATNPNFAFNTGFGSGFPGLGAASTGFNTNFASGFSSLTGNMNSNFGFNPNTINSFPVFGSSSTTLV